ncbi:hypothetical protein [Rhodopirellula baltica]
MTQRRSLVEGLSNTPEVKSLEKEFVFGEKSAEKDEDTELRLDEPKASSEEVMPQYRGRVPLTTRCRPELASAIKRASLERQLQGVEPSRIQDIIEQALERWLEANRG